MTSTLSFRPAPLRLAMLIAIGVFGGSQGTVAAESAVNNEHSVKAAFLYNFTKFVEWPSELFPSVDSPLLIGVLSQRRFGAELENTVRNRVVNGHRIVVIRLPATSNAKSLPVPCHVLFVGAGDEGKFAELVRRGACGDTLTVGESSEFAARGGMITFTTAGDKVRFEINLASVEQTGLKISSQLLKLATQVRRKP